MINVPYLLKILDTDKISELMAVIDLPPIDANLAIWDAEKAGQIEINEEKGLVRALVEPEQSFDSDLASKLLRVMQKYQSEEINVSLGYLTKLMKDPETTLGYGNHEFLMALQYLIDSGQIEKDVISVPEIKGKRPFHKFVFLQFPDNPNDDWNRNEVNKWIANWEKKK